MTPRRVLIIGAGPVGMASALELARHGARSLVLEQKPALSHVGSRAIVLARHTLQAFSRMGCADEILTRGIRLVRSRTFYRDTELSRMDFPAGNGLPPFVNLQQTHTERALLRAIERSALIEMDFSRTVTGLRQERDQVVVDTDSGRVSGAYAIACDGAHSTVRSLLRMSFHGRTCRDRFFIADIHADLPFPKERRFFFDPPSNPGRQVLMHPQPDDQWRLDWQVPVETDLAAERASGVLDRRVRALIGSVDYELVWATAYRFHQRLVDRFRAGRVFLAGDAAHLMAPFGARGLNSGIEDASNLCWKLALVLGGQAPDRLLDSYDSERRQAAKVNLRMTAGTARFMAPPTPLHRAFRDAVLNLSLRSERTRRYVNDVRFTEPAVYTRHRNGLLGRPAPVSLQDQAPCQFTALVVCGDRRVGAALADELGTLPVRVLQCSPDDDRARALGGGTDVLYLIRPDGYTAAVTRPSAGAVRTALRSALDG